MKSIFCFNCLHLYHTTTNLACRAFPQGIPKAIITGEINHTKPIKGDRGFVFTNPTTRYEVKQNYKCKAGTVDEGFSCGIEPAKPPYYTVPKNPSGPKPATTIKMAETEILSNVANRVEIGKGANLGVINEVTKCLYERLNQYPHLFTKDAMGHPRLMTLKFGNTHGAGAQNLWGTTQINISTGKNFNSIDKWKGLVSENKYYAEHSGNGKMWTSNGYVSPEDSLKSSVDHEIGHIVHYYMTSDEGNAWIKAVKAATSDLDKTWKCPTAYALKNGKELFAEMFALHMNGRSDLVHPEMNKVIDSILHPTKIISEIAPTSRAWVRVGDKWVVKTK